MDPPPRGVMRIKSVNLCKRLITKKKKRLITLPGLYILNIINNVKTFNGILLVLNQ